VNATPLFCRVTSLVMLVAAVAFAPAEPPWNDRLPVRTLTDQDVGSIDETVRPATVEQLVQLTRPSALPLREPAPALQQRRIPPTETRKCVVDADIIGYQKQPNGSYSVVIQGPSGATMIVGLPVPQSVGKRWRDQVMAARLQLEKRFNHDPGPPGPRMQRTRASAQIIGIGFFGLVGDQVGAAPNGIELQPVLSLRFR
jgi:hypothetical protein